MKGIQRAMVATKKETALNLIKSTWPGRKRNMLLRGTVIVRLAHVYGISSTWNRKHYTGPHKTAADMSWLYLSISSNHQRMQHLKAYTTFYQKIPKTKFLFFLVSTFPESGSICKSYLISFKQIFVWKFLYFVLSVVIMIVCSLHFARRLGTSSIFISKK